MSEKRSALLKHVLGIRGVFNHIVSGIHILSASTTGLFLSILFIQVFMRYAMNNPIYGLDELVVALMIWSMALGFVVVYWENGHAKIEFILKKLPHWCSAAIYYLTSIISAVSGIIMALGGITLFKMQNRTIPLGGLPFTRAYYYALPVVVMGILLALLSVVKIIDYIISRDDQIMIDMPTEGGVQHD